ncbi:hypothetical protein RHSIM_Rhsim12G0126300 [Rhododendron simsii]|uniref:TPX2 C-terminal domain-containing protein n=1 Tax=Rhododendron simsii TaxID=118357 RepID=A0A834G282_RHOSS|nr:hypothetical protein RHSIM_Rhsim12G0126300 [Rhododendron simsii]
MDCSARDRKSSYYLLGSMENKQDRPKGSLAKEYFPSDLASKEHFPTHYRAIEQVDNIRTTDLYVFMLVSMGSPVLFIVTTSAPNSTSSGMAGFEANEAREAICAPGFWLLSPDTASAVIGSVDESHENRALEAYGHFGCPWVRVKWYDPVGCQVDSSHGQALGVGAGEVSGASQSEVEPKHVGSVALFGQGRGCESWSGSGSGLTAPGKRASMRIKNRIDGSLEMESVDPLDRSSASCSWIFGKPGGLPVSFNGEHCADFGLYKQMRESSLASSTTLEVSVSFGRFENDSLSWEKWSTFSPNKYLEEVEKCSTPGSVAQKKAYFEAHYKKIAARKAAEQLEQERQMETNAGQNGEENVGNTSLTDTKLGTASNGQVSAEAELDDLIGVSSRSRSDESNENASISIERQSPSVDGIKEDEMDGIMEKLELNKSEEAVLVQEETLSIMEKLELNRSEEAVLVQEETRLNGFEGKGELPPVLIQKNPCVSEFQDKVEVESPVQPPSSFEKGRGNTMENKNEKIRLDSANKIQRVKITPSKKENDKLDASNKYQKMILSKKEKSFPGTKKKQASPLPKKSPEISTPKTSKLTPTSTGPNASWSSSKNAYSSSSPRSKFLNAGESKKVAPSLHKSLNLGIANSDSTSISTPRKSLFMEKMGDKDIVKRAFKTFQNSFNQVRASGDDKFSRRKEVSTTMPEHKLSTSLTPRKEKEGLRKTAENMDAQRAQLGRSWNTISAGSLKGAGMDHRSAKPAPSLSLRSSERSEKRKEKLEGKSYSKETEKTNLSSKSKLTHEDKDAGMKKLRQSLNFKATPMPSFYRGHTISKNSLDKGSAKNKHQLHHPQPETHGKKPDPLRSLKRNNGKSNAAVQVQDRICFDATN